MKKVLMLTLSIILIFSQIALAGNFEDVKDGYWAKENIEMLVSKGIVNGYPDKTFRPKNTISRSEFSKLIQELLGLPLNNDDSEIIFEDIEKNWAKGRIKTLVKKGIIDVEDYKEGFKPNEPMTRVEMARMIIKALEIETKEINKTSFKDDEEISKKDKKYVKTAKDTGIITGYPDKTFKPNSTATRAETAAMIVRMINYLNNDDSVEVVEGIKFDKVDDVFSSPGKVNDGAMKLDKQQEFVMKFFKSLKFTKEGENSYVSGCLPNLPTGYKWSASIKVFYTNDQDYDTFHANPKARQDILMKKGEVFKFKLKYNKEKMRIVSVSIRVMKDTGAENGLFILDYPVKTLKKIGKSGSEFLNDSINWEEMFKW
ncbi:S-layer homology domain-containing protein [Abyssisolibacter fermentans]|uniref:S-layer homology domain-containing protein n=1 Tax=Abyssisolibacter fermentans TaxID=1766203 RepID=UPI000831918A|nr:S-layer homology domain-containing protein [Abyssisolibacter fermentans]